VPFNKLNNKSKPSFKRRFASKISLFSFFYRKKAETTPIRRTQDSLLFKYKKIFFGILLFLIIILLSYVFLSFIRNESFFLRNITIIGNKSLSKEELISELNSYSNQHLFFIRSNNIKAQLYNSFSTIQDVKIIKSWPNNIIITITERDPKLVYVNIQGAYVVDQEGKILEIFANDTIAFQNENINIIRGLGNPNADYVKERYYIDNPITEESESEDNSWDTIPLKDKINTLNTIKKELTEKVEQLLSDYSAILSTTNYANLPRLYAYDNNSYKLFDTIDFNYISSTIEIYSFFSQSQEFIINKGVLESKYSILIEFTNGKKVIFGTKRQLSKQLDDFQIIIAKLDSEGINYSRIDLSSEKISVR
jgi:cell division septal protein FtsQ